MNYDIYYNTLNIYINNYLYIHYEFNNFNFLKYYYDNELYKSILFSKNLILNYFINNCDDIKKNFKPVVDDTTNFIYHFKNSKNWDILKSKVKNHKNIFDETR